MPTKPLDRLMFIQGGLCFFCRQPLPKEQASVEHLWASANGGSNSADNCVACCAAVNRLLGSMSLKEKFQVVLNQKGNFKCPNGQGAPALPKVAAGKTAAKKTQEDHYNKVVDNLRQRGAARPRTLKALASTVATLLPKGHPETEVARIVDRLQSERVITVTGTKLSYDL